MSQIINKTAISVLDEFCKRKLQPPAEYTFNSVNTTDFMCTVTAFNETKTATAKSKKTAKQVAAQNLIRQLRSLESFKFDLVFLSDPINSDDAEVSSSTKDGPVNKSTAKSDSEINYIGKLLEYCIKNKLPPASFELVEYSAHTQSHLREFHMKCRVNDIEKQGKGFCKKQAKKQAAMEVLNVLQGQFRQPVPKKIAALDEPPEKRLKTTEALASQISNDASTVPSQSKVTNDGNQSLNKSAIISEANIDKVCVISDDEDGDFSDDEALTGLISENESEQQFENESSNDSYFDGL